MPKAKPIYPNHSSSAPLPGFINEPILVVDDEPQILWLVSRFLTNAGYTILQAPDGQVALDLLAGCQDIALILTDLKMPGISGLDLLEHVQSSHPDTQVMIMTAYATIALTISALRKGVYDFLTKPLNLKQLSLAVEKALRHRHLAVQNRQLFASLQQQNLLLETLHRQELHTSEQLRRVNAITRQLTALLDTDRLITVASQAICTAFDFAWLHFGLIDGDTLTFPQPAPAALDTAPADSLEPYRDQRAPPDSSPGDRVSPCPSPGSAPLTSSPCWHLTHSGKQIFIQRDDLTYRTDADLIVPLRVGDQLLGFWVACWHKHATHRNENLPYLEALAAQTAVVLENAQLYTLAKRADELAFINRIIQATRQSLHLKETLKSVLLVAGQTADLAEITLFAGPPGPDAPSPPTHCALLQGRFVDSPNPLLGQEFTRRVGLAPLILDNAGQVEQLCTLPPPGPDSPQIRSVLGVPLLFGTHSIGVLAIGRQQPYAFYPDDGRLLETAGHQVAMAVENARLFQQVESGRRRVTENWNMLLAVFDSILDGIYIVNRRDRIVAINRTQAERVGRTYADMEDQPAQEAFPSSQDAVRCIHATFDSDQPQSHTERHTQDDGTITEWHIYTYPVTTERRTTMVVVFVRDITEQRKLEASLIQSEKMASVGQLAAGIAHEINNPLTVISTNVEILQEEIPADADTRPSIDLICRASDRASQIVRSLLRFSRPDRTVFGPTDINRTLQDTLSLIEQQLRKANIKLSIDLAPNLPSIWGNLNHLRTVWLNLILNARDAIRESEISTGQIQVSSSLSPISDSASPPSGTRGVIVRISDNGTGMPPDVLTRIYDPFFTTKAPDKGTGLGLFNCYRAVEQHHGEIRVETQAGAGTTFEILLPIQTPTTEPSMGG